MGSFQFLSPPVRYARASARASGVANNMHPLSWGGGTNGKNPINEWYVFVSLAALGVKDRENFSKEVI